MSALRIGLVGYCCDTGLGIATRDFFVHLPFQSWLVIPHPLLGVDSRHLDGRCVLYEDKAATPKLAAWLGNLDVVFFIQSHYISGLIHLAARMGVRTVLMPNAEWFDPAASSLRLLSRMIAPTHACADLVTHHGFGTRTVYIPHAIDTTKFAFQRRESATTFLHCRGWGGYKERKGTDLVWQVSEECRNVSFVLRSQDAPGMTWGSNVSLLGATVDPEEQYALGDIAIQPSRWEGVGLQILEAMSCGMPTIVPDAPPMNEYPADPRLCVPATPKPIAIGNRKWTAWDADTHEMAATVKRLNGTSVSDWSEAARRRMEERSWSRIAPLYLETLAR